MRADRKSTRLDSRHTDIYTLSLHDALPIWRMRLLPSRCLIPDSCSISKASEICDRFCVRSGHAGRSEEHTSGLPSHRYLHSFPTRRSSDLADALVAEPLPNSRFVLDLQGERDLRQVLRAFRPCGQIGRAHVWTPVTPISTLFPYTTLFRSGGCACCRAAA